MVGFSLSKILVERKAPIQKAVVNSKIDILGIDKEEFEIEKGKETLKVNFAYTIDYTPNLAIIELKGHLLVLADKKESEIIFKEWKKSGKVATEFNHNVFNAIFQKCNIKALELGEEFGFPPHIQLPTIQLGERKEEKK